MFKRKKGNEKENYYRSNCDRCDCRVDLDCEYFGQQLQHCRIPEIHPRRLIREIKNKRSDKMTREIIAIALLLLGGLGIIVLLTYGGPVFPHIIGPTTVAVIGAIVLLFKRKSK
jgi:hypothetical protein